MGISGKYTKTDYECTFGERNETNNKLQGRGICIDTFGSIWIQYWNNGKYAPGNYIKICSDGEFCVGE